MTARKQKRTCGCRSDARGNRAAVFSSTAASHRLTASSRRRGQLVSVSTNGAFAESYAYDPLGRRVSTTSLSTVNHEPSTVYHVYDGDQCAADLDASGQPLRVYTWGPGVDSLLAVTVYSSGATNSYYAVKDRLGSVRALVDSQGQVVQSYTYDAWGNVSASTPNSSFLTPNFFLFHGGAYSAATGLYQFRARWYSPELGRWLSPDPIGLEGGLNLYEFCGNDPVNYRDPSGLTVYYLPDGGDHAGLFYSNPESSTGWSYFGKEGEGADWPSWNRTLAENARMVWNAFDSEGISQTGDRPATYMQGVDDALKLDMTCEEEEKLRAAIDNYDYNRYKVLTANCTQAVRDVLNESGFLSNSISYLNPYPSGLTKDLQERNEIRQFARGWKELVKLAHER